jgi:hypothetical protein
VAQWFLQVKQLELSIIVTESLNVQNVLFHFRDSHPRSFPPMNIIPVTEAEIKSISYSSKAKDSSGYEEISSKILKLCGTQLSKPLSYICNKSISMSIFPESLKYGIVKPLYKNGDKSNMANYRPICLLKAFSKVIETTMCHKLNHHLQLNNILVGEQYGFRKGLSTENAAYTLADSIFKAWNSKFHVGGICCDLAKAFDCENH